jgi:hypothetical protein
MRRFLFVLGAALVLGLGVGFGLSAKPAAAIDPPDCFVKCKNGFESVCCPRRLPQCIQTLPPTPC